MNYLVSGCAHRQALPKTSHLFSFALRPVTRRLAIQFNDALGEVLADLIFGRLHSFLGCESDCVVVRK